MRLNLLEALLRWSVVGLILPPHSDGKFLSFGLIIPKPTPQSSAKSSPSDIHQINIDGTKDIQGRVSGNPKKDKMDLHSSLEGLSTLSTDDQPVTCLDKSADPKQKGTLTKNYSLNSLSRQNLTALPVFMFIRNKVLKTTSAGLIDTDNLI